MKPATIDVEATRTLKKPQVQIELAKFNDKAKQVVLEVIDYSKELGKQGNTAGAAYAGHALTGANSIIDRNEGKAKQTIEQHSTTVTLSLSLKDITLNPDTIPENK